MSIRTGIPGLDEIMGGGLIRGNCILLHGRPGSGKTIFALQFLYNGVIKSGEPGVFVTLCESPGDIRKNMLIFGWDLEKLEKQKKIVIVDARPVTFNNNGMIIPKDALFKGERIPFSHISKLIVQTGSVSKS